MSDPRHNARILAVQYLYENSFPGIEVTPKDQQYNPQNLKGIDGFEKYNQELYEKLITGFPQNSVKIDKLIEMLAPEWPIDKIAKLDLHILRISILEGYFLKITPEKVAIDEAIELSKEFSNDQSRKFVSGVLGTLFENIDEYSDYVE